MKVKIRIRKLLSIPFLVLLIISSALWLAGKLSHTYTTQIEVPINIVTDYNSGMWVDDGMKTVRCKATADGRDLLLYKLGLVPRLTVPLSLLTLKEAGDVNNIYLYKVGEQSLEKAIMQVQNKFTVNIITDTMPTFVMSHLMGSRIRVASMVDVECADGYMLHSGLRLSVDSIDIKAPLSVLDTLSSIPTRRVVVRDARGAINGTVELDIPSSVVVASNNVIRYEALSVPFTELVYFLPIEVVGNVEAVALPRRAKVKLRVPLSSFSSVTTPVLFINTNSESRSGYYPIKVSDLSPGVVVTSVEPVMAQYFIQK